MQYLKKLKIGLKFSVSAFLLSLGAFKFAFAADLVTDSDVTVVGRGAARAREVLDWALNIKNSGFDGQNVALHNAWSKISSFTSIIVFVVVLVFAFGLICILTGHKSSAAAFYTW